MEPLTPTQLIEKATPILPRSPVSHSEFRVTAIQRENLTKLASHLYTLPTGYQRFSMKYWSYDKDGHINYSPSICGTVACAAGHGPIIGIEALPEESWESYIRRVFGTTQNKEIDFLFSSAWSNVDNTPRGAALRIFYALQHGVPVNIYDLIGGEASLFYH